MAMEINHSKNLHLALLPVSLTLLVLSLAGLGFALHDGIAAKLGRGLTTQVIKVTPQSNGLSNFDLSTESKQTLGTISESGRSAELSIEFQAL